MPELRKVPEMSDGSEFASINLYWDDLTEEARQRIEKNLRLDADGVVEFEEQFGTDYEEPIATLIFD